MNNNPIHELLSALGWPSAERDNKGSLSWQRPINHQGDILSSLPPTASLVVTPRVIRAKILNINPSENIEPHFEAEWSLTPGSPPSLTKMVYAAQDPSDPTTSDQAVKLFKDLRELINGQPKLSVLGVRDKSPPSVQIAP